MKLSTQILLAFMLVLLLSVFDTGANYLLSLKVEKNTIFLTRSHEVIRNSTGLHKKMIDMQSSFRGYLLTDDNSFLEAYNNGLATVPAQFAELKELITTDSIQLKLFEKITALHYKWVQYAEGLIEAKKTSIVNDSGESYRLIFENQFRKQTGKKINNEISRTFSEFDSLEYIKRKLHSENLAVAIKDTHSLSLVIFIITIVIGVTTAGYVVYRIAKRIKMMVWFAENISRGKFTAIQDNYNDELTNLSLSLNRMSENLQENINDLKSRNTELDQFAYAVSHDLKAPVRVIHNVINWTEEDLAEELSPQLKKYLDIIRERAIRMENLINGLLDYARVRKKNPAELINLNEMVHQLVDTIVPRNVKVEVDELPIIHADRLKLEQVFSNLISNAVKYSPEPTAHLIISCKDEGNYYEFSVKDNGIGIDPQYHSRIFEMFQTLREKNEQESTGIGLALIKKIIEDQKGTIRVESTLGNGANFIFTWPRM